VTADGDRAERALGGDERDAERGRRSGDLVDARLFRVARRVEYERPALADDPFRHRTAEGLVVAHGVRASAPRTDRQLTGIGIAQRHVTGVDTEDAQRRIEHRLEQCLHLEGRAERAAHLVECRKLKDLLGE